MATSLPEMVAGLTADGCTSSGYRSGQHSGQLHVRGTHQGWRGALACVACLALLVSAGNLIVTGSKGISLSFGIDESVIGAAIVAIGISVLELATTVIAKFRGHDEVGLGTILGSNIFNGLLSSPSRPSFTP